MKKSAFFPIRLRLSEKAFSFDAAKSFFEGRPFVMLLAFITLAGHVLSLDGVTVPLMLTLTSFAVLISESLLPLLPTLLIFIYQISVKNSPAIPSFSDYYFTGWRLPAFLAALILLFLVCLCTFFLRASFKVKSLPDLKASIPLALAFLFNGAISGEWRDRKSVV